VKNSRDNVFEGILVGREEACLFGQFVYAHDFAAHTRKAYTQDVRKFAWVLQDVKYHNFHTSYSLGWVQMLMDCYEYSGDRALVEELAPYVHELLDTYATWRGKNGIVSDAPNYMFMDWVKIGGMC
jgi:hypothetical protein